MVLVTDGKRSFILFSYGDIQWGNGENLFIFADGIVIVRSQIGNTATNVGIPGVFSYRIDQEDIIEPCLTQTGSY